VPALPPNSFSIREKVRLRGNVDPANTNPPPTANTPTQPINIAVIALPRVSNHDDLDPFRRAGCRIRVVTNPAELAPAHIIIPGSKSTIADLRWMKSRGLDTAIIEAASKRDVTVVVVICGGYEIHTGITTGASSNLSTLEDTDYRVPSEVIEAEGPGQRRIHARPSANARTEQTEGTRSTILRAKGRRHGLGQGRLPRATESSDDDRSQNEKRATSRPTTTEPNATPDGTISPTPPVIGTYVHGLFDSPEILRRLLNTTAETHNLPEPLIAEFSMDAEYDRLAQVVRESIDMNLINSLIR
jgi:adenosylcobyric acid synthase